MSRSLKKGPYVNEKLLKKVKQVKSGGNVIIKTWDRACTIIPDFVGHSFGVHNGRDFIKVKVTDDMVGHKLGEFSPTKVWRGHGGKKARDEAASATRQASKT